MTMRLIKKFLKPRPRGEFRPRGRLRRDIRRSPARTSCGKLNSPFAFPPEPFFANATASFPKRAAAGPQRAKLMPRIPPIRPNTPLLRHAPDAFRHRTENSQKMIKPKKFARSPAAFALRESPFQAFMLIDELHAMPSVRADREFQARADFRQGGLHGLRPLDAQNTRRRSDLVHEKIVERLRRRKPVRVYMRKPPAAGNFIDAKYVERRALHRFGNSEPPRDSLYEIRLSRPEISG